MIHFDTEKFAAVAADAHARAQQAPQDSRRWVNAINKASEILSTNPLWHLMDDDVLLLVSPQSFEVYEVGVQSCERIDGEKRVDCPAHAVGRPCWHRAARRLVLLYAED